MLVHLIDGTYELFRMFYAPGSGTKDPDGVEVGATRNIVRSFAAMLAGDDVTHVAVAFDHVIESFRNELFDGYKTGLGIDPELRNQFELAEDACRALGLVVWPMIDFEADDALATGAAFYGADERVERVLLATPDKDLGQCVRGTRVVQWDRMRRKILDEDAVRAKMGVAPGSIPDYLALVGDTADGIPGIPRWGAKSTAAVLTAYEHLENIPDDADDWKVKVRGAATLAKNLAAQRADAELYKRLATLRTDAPLRESLDELEWRGADREALTALCARLGDTTHERIARWR